MEQVNVKELLNDRIKKCKILVIGDVMLDRYFYGQVTRISPEAPVPIALIKKKRNVLGGAGNVAHNLIKLGCQVWIAGVIGDDHHGRLLRTHMSKLNIGDQGIFVGRDNTTTKTRILGGPQQMMRIDFEESDPIKQECECKILEYIKNRIDMGIDAIIISDYNKGVCTNNLCKGVISYAHENNCLVFVDPKGNDWQRYHGADYITPNVKELSVISGHDLINNDETIKNEAMAVSDRYKIKNIIVTRSEKGMSIISKNLEYHLPTVARDVYDVSGAGDTVISTFAASISAGMDLRESAELANLAAGIEVSKVGTYAVGREDIMKELKFMKRGK